MPAVALCDRDGVYGAPRFTRAALDAGVKPIIGSEITLTDGSRLPLLVEDREGYQNLCHLITRMKLGAAKGSAAVTLAELAPYAAGLVCLTGGAYGPLALRLDAGDVAGARGAPAGPVTIFRRAGGYAGGPRPPPRGAEPGGPGPAAPPPAARPDAARALARAGGAWRARALRHGTARHPRAPPGGLRDRRHRAPRPRGLLPDRVGHRRVLPRERHPRARARLGGQQRSLLRARHHGGRSRRHGTPVRAVPLRGARRVARHRPRSPEWSASRSRDPARLPALRAPRRRDDRERDHV